MPTKRLWLKQPYSQKNVHNQNERKEIALATKEEVVFFHELAHAAHTRVKEKLKSGQDWKQEIVAELTAAVLCQMVGKDGQKYLGNSYFYIESYSKKAKISSISACFQVIGEVEKVLEKIFEYQKPKIFYLTKIMKDI